MLDTRLLGVRIREARKRLDLSQEDLAAAVEKDQGAISEYESGVRRLFATDLPRFAEALQVPLTYFFEGDAVHEDLDAVLLDVFHQLPDRETQQTIIGIVRLLLDRFKHLRLSH